MRHVQGYQAPGPSSKWISGLKCKWWTSCHSIQAANVPDSAWRQAQCSLRKRTWSACISSLLIAAANMASLCGSNGVISTPHASGKCHIAHYNSSAPFVHWQPAELWSRTKEYVWYRCSWRDACSLTVSPFLFFLPYHCHMLQHRFQLPYHSLGLAMCV